MRALSSGLASNSNQWVAFSNERLSWQFSSVIQPTIVFTSRLPSGSRVMSLPRISGSAAYLFPQTSPEGLGCSKILGSASLPDDRHDQVAAVRRGPVLEQENALPGAELDASVHHRDRQLNL